MTIAWKLFYFRTSRDIRSSTPRQQQQHEQGEEEDHDPALDFRRRDRDRDRDPAVRGHSRTRPQQGKASPLPPPRHPLHRAAAQLNQEREPVVLEKARTSEHGARNSNESGLAHSCVGRTFNGRLPGSVMEARSRLTERLRSCHLAESRPNDPTTGVSLDAHESVELAIADSGDHLHTVTATGLQEETFVGAGEIDGAPRAPAECSICLERFLEGDGLVRLHCGHRFHHACSEPWFQAHGVCPYCRASA